MSNIVGIVPAISSADPQLSYPCPMEMIPVGHAVSEGRRMFRPLAQLAVEGLMGAGVDHVVMVVNERKLPVMEFFRDGMRFGMPITYVWERAPGVAAGVDAAYHLSAGRDVLMVMPGVAEPKAVEKVMAAHRAREVDLTLSVGFNAILDDDGAAHNVRSGQMAGVFAWGPAFTEFLRDFVSRELEEGREPTMESALAAAQGLGLRVYGLKLQQQPLVKDPVSWSKTVFMVQQRVMVTANELSLTKRT